MTRKGCRWSTCYHEAGHALARWYFGHSTERAVVLTREELRAGLWGCDPRGFPIRAEGFVIGELIPPWGTAQNSKGAAALAKAKVNREQLLIVLFAGVEAEAAYRKVSKFKCYLDSGFDDCQEAGRIIEDWFPIDEHAQADTIAIRRAGALVRSKLGAVAIKHMASALMEHGEIDGKDIDCICRKAYGGQKPSVGSWVSYWPPTLADMRNGVVHEDELKIAA